MGPYLDGLAGVTGLSLDVVVGVLGGSSGHSGGKESDSKGELHVGKDLMK